MISGPYRRPACWTLTVAPALGIAALIAAMVWDPFGVARFGALAVLLVALAAVSER